MKLLSVSQFPYPNLSWGQAWCEVEVYRLGMEVLVVLRDHDDHGGTSVTNAIETVAQKVHEEILVPQKLASLSTHWVHWSRTDGVYSLVFFDEPGTFARPHWRYLPPQDFARVEAAFEGEGPLEGWMQQGALDLETWAESQQEHNSPEKS
ncbi:MAG: hypothetical protein KatS3mg071_1739 [Meiothermus sp.]|nr:MAG: hypothetical protein KatS3mg071_1739 [Meiothermus sp.]